MFSGNLEDWIDIKYKEIYFILSFKDSFRVLFGSWFCCFFFYFIGVRVRIIDRWVCLVFYGLVLRKEFLYFFFVFVLGFSF